MITYPQYRKSANGLHLYKIISANEFVELQRVGSRVLKYTIEARQYPEMVRITDMLQLNGFLESTGEEFKEASAAVK